MSDPDTIGCEEALKHLAEFVDRELAETEQRDVERHLHTCRSCYSRMEFESRLKQQLSALSSDETPAVARDRILRLIRGF